MPDPMKNTDIEDVLSSIRRLVSYDASQLQPRQPAPEPSPEKLVLTPALRVYASDQPDPDAPADKPAATAVPEFTRRPRDTDPVVPHSVDPAPEDGQTLEDRIAELEAAVSRSEGEWEPDGSETEADVYPTACPVIEPSPRRMHLAEPEGARASAPEADELISADDDPADVADPATPQAPALAAGNLDQNALRELVRQMIREELQGALGERITRNVRKLVRREINRTLISKEFD